MNTADIKRQALTFAIQAEIEGMKCENMQRVQLNESNAFSYKNFCEKAEELRVLAAMHDDEV